MSNYIAKAINPDTGKTEEAEFLDGYFGWREYGIRFSDGTVMREEHVEIPPNPSENKGELEL